MDPSLGIVVPAEAAASRSRMHRAGAVASAALLAMLAGCSTVTLPDTAELSRASAQVAIGLDAAHRHTRQLLERAFSAPMACPAPDLPGAGSLGAGACFAAIFQPRVEAARAVADYAATLTEIFAAGRNHDGADMMEAAGELLARLGLPALPAAIRSAAGAALDTWKQRRAAATVTEAVARADVHVQALVGAMVADLDEVRGLIVSARQKLVLELVLRHNDELALRQTLERRRHELTTQIPVQDPGQPAVPPRSQPPPADIAAELAAIQSALAALPRREDLRPAGIDQALAVIDAAQAALAEWGHAHKRLVTALEAGRSPELGLLDEAAAAVRHAARTLDATETQP